MKARRKRIRGLLQGALEHRQIVDFQTRSDENIHEFGFVFALTDDFVLIQNVSKDVFLDGYSVFPLREIRAVLVGQEGFLPRGLAHLGQIPSAPSSIGLEDIPSLLASADVHFPLISLEVARKAPGCLYIGRVSSLKKTSVRLRQITSSANWESRPRKYRFRDITRIDFGGRYESALWRVAQSELTISDNP